MKTAVEWEFLSVLCKVYSYIPIRVVYLARPSTRVTSLAWPDSILSVRVVWQD